MKKYFKKFSIMFVMLLAMVGVGVIQNGVVANAATVGQQLTAPESGWQRYDDTNSKIQYDNVTRITDDESSNNKTRSYINGDQDGNIKFTFYGTELRIIALTQVSTARSKEVTVAIDNNIVGTYTRYTSFANQILLYEKTGLTSGVHTVKLSINGGTADDVIDLDAIDIDLTGELLQYDESITLDKSSMDLTVGDSEQLTATTTPAGLGVFWTSSDSNVAIVDENGNVTGMKEGQVIITATTADGLTTTCSVNVIPKGTVPTDPEEPVGDGSLFIELVDGNIKQYDATSSEITNFINWYNNRDNDDSQPPYYKFTKGTYKDYVIHDKIDWFEVR
jgi:uncharacterized protein YjdB